MSKKYIAIYLPVEGEIKRGDKYLHPNGCIQQLSKQVQLDLLPNINKIGKLVKLFLCSRDIQVGDTFVNPRWNLNEWKEHICTKIEMGSGENYFPKKMLIWFHDDGINFWFPLEECYKKIGEISPDALGYVKEGDEFEEDQWAYAGRGVQKSNYGIAIKGPCGHFH